MRYAIDEDAFFNEHSISAIAPFARYFFPDSRIVPLIVRADADTVLAGALAGFVTKRSSGRVLFLASLDFSHHKPSRVAMEEDVVTYDILCRLDVANFRKASVDSHIIFRTVLVSCKLLGAIDIGMIHHTNSGIFESRPTEPCTSYMNMLLH